MASAEFDVDFLLIPTHTDDSSANPASNDAKVEAGKVPETFSHVISGENLTVPHEVTNDHGLPEVTESEHDHKAR